MYEKATDQRTKYDQTTDHSDKTTDDRSKYNAAYPRYSEYNVVILLFAQITWVKQRGLFGDFTTVNLGASFIIL